MNTTTNQASGVAEPDDERATEFCPQCGGSGDAVVMSDGGPDAYEVTIYCPHCHGKQTLYAAYQGVVELLDLAEIKLREASAIIWRAGTGRGDGGEAVSQINNIADYLANGGQNNAWCVDRLRGLAALATKPAESKVCASVGVEPELRPEVLAFARVMETKLRKHDGKPGWKGDSREALRMRIYDEWKELTAALRETPESPERIRSEAADVANFAMMIADNWGGLTDQPIDVPKVDLDSILEAMIEQTDCILHDSEYRLDGAELMGLLRRVAALASPAPSVGEPITECPYCHACWPVCLHCNGIGIDASSESPADKLVSEARADRDKFSDDLNKARNLILRLYNTHPAARPMIEGATGPWLGWGKNRDATPPAAPAATEAPSDDMVMVSRDLLGAACSAIDKKRDAPTVLEKLRAITFAAPAVGASPEVTDAMVAAYLKANDAYWKRTDELPGKADKWRTGTPTEATRESLIAALAAVGASVQPVQASLSDEQINRAAKVLASCMDYPWEHMPEKGRGEMRRHAESVVTAALASSTPTKGGEAS